MNEAMHILTAFMMVMTSSAGTMPGECWDSGSMLVGNRGDEGLVFVSFLFVFLRKSSNLHNVY